MRKTYDHAYLCRQYFVLTAAIREQTRILRENRCPEKCANEFDDVGRITAPGQDSCLGDYFTARAVGVGESECLTRLSECPQCSAALSAIKKRKELRHALAGVKRQIANAGKSLEAPCS